MTAPGALDLGAVTGLRWLPSGQSILSGALLGLEAALDGRFRSWAMARGAEEFRVPPFIAARDLARIDYFHSFPHLATFPVVLAGDEANLADFAAGEALDPGGAVRLRALAPVREVLTPAACYHFYGLLQGAALERAAYLTTRAQCFRREAAYAALQRQWAFSMREIVCVGTADEVKGFLDAEQARVARFLDALGLPVAFAPATDPFFRPARNRRYLAQRLDPVKTEIVYGGRLALGSINFHRNYFGEAFGIWRAGRAAFSGCVAFGIERWIYAVLDHFGPAPGDWPVLADG